MWLPDYFIEVTPHFGKSVFAEGASGISLKAHLALASRWWQLQTPFPEIPGATNGGPSTSGRSTLWQARILTVPFGSWANNYPPLASSIGTGVPVCYSAVSEFLYAQWNLNKADGAFAAAWAPVGIPACLSSAGALAMGAMNEAKSKVQSLPGVGTGAPNLPVDLACGSPVTDWEAGKKNLLPTSDALSPLLERPHSISSKLCMGTWGNLLPRTGWVASEDPHMAALMAAYKFQSAAGDFHLNPNIKMRPDDKWQIIYPPVQPASCFKPGEPFAFPFTTKMENAVVRGKDELSLSAKAGVYVIAVWRKRTSCQEPLETFGTWTADYKLNFQKNKALCAGFSNPEAL